MTDLSKKGFSCTSSSSPTASFSHFLETFEQGGLVCIEEGCGLRVCHCAHKGICSLVINESRGDLPPRAGRRDCFRGGSAHGRHGSHCLFFFMKVVVGVCAEASSKSTDLVVRQLLFGRSSFNLYPLNLAHSQTICLVVVSLLSIGVACFFDT